MGTIISVKICVDIKKYYTHIIEKNLSWFNNFYICNFVFYLIYNIKKYSSSMHYATYTS